MPLSRRQFTAGALAGSLVAAVPIRSNALAGDPTAGKLPQAGEPFSFDRLIEAAEALSRHPSKPLPRELPPWLDKLDYDGYRAINFRTDQSLFTGDDSKLRMQMFHRGYIFHDRVRVFTVRDGRCDAVKFSPKFYQYGQQVQPGAIPDDLGFAGVRFLRARSAHQLDEFLSFLGASYFRGIGLNQTYGLSARGLAIDTVTKQAEEFPVFTTIYVREPEPGSMAVTVWALLQSPGATGAYEFKATAGRKTLIDVTARVFARYALEKLGIAPLTSMYWYGQPERRPEHEFRPQIHDSDGLLIAHRDGRRLWRPLMNPSRVHVEPFEVNDLAGFGLMQRDRVFSHYQDLEARYHNRPSGWVQPLGDWGPGSVELVELPTDNEANDNIVAYWRPAKPVVAGKAIDVSYRLSFGERLPEGDGAYPVTATQMIRRSPRQATFIVDWRDGQNAQRDMPKARVTVNGVPINTMHLMRHDELPGWRLLLDIDAAEHDSIVIHASLNEHNDSPLFETWSYTWLPS